MKRCFIFAARLAIFLLIEHETREINENSRIDKMELRQLKMFIKLVEILNFTEAARQLTVSQSSLSQNIKQLEEELGGALFCRSRHEVKLTETGAELAKYASQIIHTEEDCRSAIQDLVKFRSGLLRVGVTNVFVPMATEVVAEFSRLYPKVKISLNQGTVGDLMKMLKKQEIDVLLAFRLPSEEEDSSLVCTPLFAARLAVITRDTHPLASRSSVKVEEIVSYVLALPVKSILSRRLFDNLLRQRQLSVDVCYEMNLALPLLNLVRRSSILTILSTASLQAASIPDLCSIPLDEENCTLTGCFIVNKSDYLRHSAVEFLRLAQEYVKYHQL